MMAAGVEDRGLAPSAPQTAISTSSSPPVTTVVPRPEFILLWLPPRTSYHKTIISALLKAWKFIQTSKFLQVRKRYAEPNEYVLEFHGKEKTGVEKNSIYYIQESQSETKREDKLESHV